MKRNKIFSLSTVAKNKIRQICRRVPVIVSEILQWLGLQLYIKTQGSYQPIVGKNKVVQFDLRESNLRWIAIKQNLIKEDRSAIDLGCAQGYFTYKFAQLGLFAIGVDNSPQELWIPQNQNICEKRRNLGFILSDINQEFVKNMPVFDVVLFSSVMHHFMYENGVEWCKELMTNLRRKTGRVMFFEMGQSNEHTHKWGSRLPDMGSDPHSWIADFLRSSGFKNVKVIGTFSPDVRLYGANDTRRALFKAS